MARFLPSLSLKDHGDDAGRSAAWPRGRPAGRSHPARPARGGLRAPRGGPPPRPPRTAPRSRRPRKESPPCPAVDHRRPAGRAMPPPSTDHVVAYAPVAEADRAESASRFGSTVPRATSSATSCPSRPASELTTSREHEQGVDGRRPALGVTGSETVGRAGWRASPAGPPAFADSGNSAARTGLNRCANPASSHLGSSARPPRPRRGAVWRATSFSARSRTAVPSCPNASAPPGSSSAAASGRRLGSAPSRTSRARTGFLPVRRSTAADISASRAAVRSPAAASRAGAVRNVPCTGSPVRRGSSGSGQGHPVVDLFARGQTVQRGRPGEVGPLPEQLALPCARGGTTRWPTSPRSSSPAGPTVLTPGPTTPSHRRPVRPTRHSACPQRLGGSGGAHGGRRRRGERTAQHWYGGCRTSLGPPDGSGRCRARARRPTEAGTRTAHEHPAVGAPVGGGLPAPGPVSGCRRGGRVRRARDRRSSAHDRTPAAGRGVHRGWRAWP